ncbi:MAG TPA: helix-hairpin-helix domain-containing protein, partial [Candidatus Limnocylindrales bacterium]
ERSVDRTTSPWRALEDPAGATEPAEPLRPDLVRRHRAILAAACLSLAIIITGIVVLIGSNGSPVVSITSAGGDSPSLGPGDVAGGLAAGGDGGGPAGQVPDGSSGTDSAGSPGGDAETSSEPATLVVEVAGAVARPGLYHLAAGARVADAIAAAGGYGPRIDIGRATAELNLAARVSDGDKVIVPSRDDPAAQPGGGGSSGSSPGPPQAPARTGPLDLNTATAEELDALPGIGPVTLAKIIASRTQERFHAVSDLRTRKLVGAAEFAEIQKLVTVR